MSLKRVTIYTDGACLRNPGPGGFGALLIYGKARREIRGGEPATTNNRMELLAAIAALEALKEPCEVRLVSDSQYLIRGMTEWVAGWIAKGWRTASKRPVENRDLWERLVETAGRHRVRWEWIRGHEGHPENERCDAMAKEEITRRR